MATTSEVSVAFAGTKGQKELAEFTFNMMRARGMNFAHNAPIRVTMDSLTTFLAEARGSKPKDIQAMLDANTAIFSVETIETRTFEPAPEVEAVEAAEGEDETEAEEVEIPEPVEIITETVWVSTTRAGVAPVVVEVENVHSFAQRLMTPEPKIEKPAAPVKERPRVDPSWASFTIPVGDFDEEEDDEEFETTEDVVETAAPEEAVVEEATAAEEMVAEVETVQEDAAVEEPEPEAEPVAAEAISVDFSTFSDDAVAASIVENLSNDARVAHFGDQWMAEDRVPRLSRGDLRRIKDAIEGDEQPLTDSVLVQEILNVRPNSADFPVLQFAMNYRLAKEHRDFEFVGTNDQRFWNSTANPALGTQRKKPNEIGTDYRFLVDMGVSSEPRSVQSVDHVVTFYEYYLGLLPLDADMQALLPKPLIPDQKSAVLTFEFPQNYTTYLVEVRYPTPNRGGFLLGLDDIYAEIVPGAMISVSATENDGHYKVEYLAGESQSLRLLELDDRRSARYLFRPTAFNCAVDDAWVISEDRFPRLGSEKPLDDKQRRRVETVVETTFERIGEQDGNTWLASFADLLAAVNIERPLSADALRQALESHAAITDAGDDTFTYDAQS